tara:strand:+ start:373 stop:699 length:327 start_codon:yes stop_codon:yes gene_type:complete
MPFDLRKETRRAARDALAKDAEKMRKGQLGGPKPKAMEAGRSAQEGPRSVGALSSPQDMSPPTKASAAPEKAASQKPQMAKPEAKKAKPMKKKKKKPTGNQMKKPMGL